MHQCFNKRFLKQFSKGHCWTLGTTSHCAKYRKVDSRRGPWIHRLNPTVRAMTLGSTQPLTEVSGGWGGQCACLTIIPAECLELFGASTSWSPTGLSKSVLGQFYFSFQASRSEKYLSAMSNTRNSEINLSI
jgi:hypothetical protein